MGIRAFECPFGFPQGKVYQKHDLYGMIDLRNFLLGK